MIRALICLALLSLAGCAGQATYNVRPFYDAASQQVLCCEAAITNSKNIKNVTVHVAKTGPDYTIDFTETGVNASAPIAAASIAASDVAAAVTSAAATAAKFAP
jgi:hypothetical protein